MSNESLLDLNERIDWWYIDCAILQYFNYAFIGGIII